MSSPLDKRSRRKATTAAVRSRSSSTVTHPVQHRYRHHQDKSSSTSHSNTNRLTPERQLSVSHCAEDESRSSSPITTPVRSPLQSAPLEEGLSASRVVQSSDPRLDRSSSPSLLFARSSSFDREDSVCTRSSPPTSLCGRIEEHSEHHSLSDSDSEVVELVIGSGSMSPLAYKRKGSTTSLDSHSNKKRRQDEVSPTKSFGRTRKEMVPEVVIVSPQKVFPSSKDRKLAPLPVPTRRTALVEVIDLCSSSEEEKDEDEDDDDDDITLLATRRSISDHVASSPTGHSTSVQQSRPVPESKANAPRSTSSARRTPLKNAMEKLKTLMEDIFEAETDISGGDDTITAESMSSHAKAFFVKQDDLPPMLKSKKIAQLTRLAKACPSSRVTGAGSDEKDGTAPVQWSQVDPQELSQLIKIMHRGVDCASGLNPFPVIDASGTSPTKKKRSSRKQSAQTEEEDATLLTDEVLEQTLDKLCRIAYSITGADSCLSLLSKEGTSMELLCEEMILPCLHSIKTTLDNVVVPLVEACSESSSCRNQLLDELVTALGSTDKDKSPKKTKRTGLIASCDEQLGITFTSLSSSLPKLQALLQKHGLVLSETMAYVLADGLLPTFFTLDPDPASLSSSENDSTKVAALASLRGGSTPMKSLRLSAIDILRLTYEKSKEQKPFIVNSILDSMQSLQDTRKQARRQFGLTNGKAICSSTALLLQIIQASSEPVSRAKKVQDLMDWDADDEAATPESDKTAAQSDVFKVDMLREGQDLARQAAKDMAQCLMHKVASIGQAKASKNAAPSESGFASVIESLVSDLLDTLTCPEWPSSSLLLSQLCDQFCNYLDDEAGNPEVRSIALDQLGLMAKQWNESKLQSQSSVPPLESARSILEVRDIKSVEQLNRAYWIVIGSLRLRSDGEGSTEAAARFLEAQWGREMMMVLYQSNDMVVNLPEDAGQEEEAKLSTFVREVDTLVGQMVLAANVPEQIKEIVEAGDDAMPLSVTDAYQKLMHTFGHGARLDIIEDQLIAASSGPNATNRNKAVRGLSLICEVHSEILLKESVRSAIQRGLYDGSVNVRDTAVGLLSKFALSRPEHLLSVLPSLKEKLQDTALLIRKRTLRFFRDLYDASSEESIQVDAAVEIVSSVFDEEETMRDLAIESVAQIWFALSISLTGKGQSNKTPNGRAAIKQPEVDDDRDGRDWQDEAEKGNLQRRLSYIVQVANRLRVKPSPVQEVLQRLVKKCEGDELQRQMAQLVHLTIDNIVGSQQVTQEPVAAEQLVEQVEVIGLLVQTYPSILSIRKAKLLLPYLRGGSREAEVRLLRSLLAIFSSCLPLMASTAVSFAKQLQTTLTPLVNRPSNHAAVLEELIKCYCIVVRSHTHDFSILINCMQMCHRQVKKIQSQGLIKEAEARNARVLILMTSLLAESADYDAIRLDHPTFAAEIDTISSISVSEEVASILVDFMEVAALRSCALHSLRFVCRAFPKMMTGVPLEGVMVSILKTGTISDRLLVLRIFADIMESDSAKHDADQFRTGRDKAPKTPKKVAREELAGESDSQGNPVTFEIVSRYGDMIQALAVHVPLQRLVLEIVEVIVLRGICHPLQYLSTIIALQSVTTDKCVSNKAQSLHRHLINKSNTAINFRQAQHAREAWHFQRARFGEEVMGYTEQGEALFETWYNTLKEQKKTRMELLKALVKAFDVDTSTEACTPDDVHYARFAAENLAELKYKTVEEVVLVASEVNSILTVTGEQVQISIQEEVPIDGEDEDEEGMDEESRKRAMVIGRMSTILSMALRLLMHLREQYGLKEAQISRGMEKKSSNVAAVRKGSEGSVIALGDLPGAFSRKESMSLAKAEMNTFDHMLNSEGIGGNADDDDSD